MTLSGKAAAFSYRCYQEQCFSVSISLPYRPGGTRFYKETYIQNSACLNLLGKARPLEEYTALVDAMPDWERCNRRDWADAITQVQSIPVTCSTADDCCQSGLSSASHSQKHTL